MSIGKHAITTETPKNVLLGAGTFYRDLTFTEGKWNGTAVGATNGGGKIEIKGELQDLELDGALVKFKGQTVKMGGTASMEVNFAEISTSVMKAITLFKEGESDAEGYTMLVDKAAIEEGDYLDNFGFVGKTANGAKDIIVIFETSLCTSGLELDTKNKEQAVLKATLECYAENEGDLDTLPIKIYYPTAKA